MVSNFDDHSPNFFLLLCLDLTNGKHALEEHDEDQKLKWVGRTYLRPLIWPRNSRVLSLFASSCMASPPKRSRGKPALAKDPINDSRDISESGLFRQRTEDIYSLRPHTHQYDNVDSLVVFFNDFTTCNWWKLNKLICITTKMFLTNVLYWS